MKGGKGRNSYSEQLQEPFEPSATVNGGGDFAKEEWRKNQEESEKLVSAEETFEEEEGEDGESAAEKDYEQIEGEEAGEEKREMTKLADGYYEIEAVRRKRVRKGQVQYLIKWRGWPETANTWEPFESFWQCSDVIDAFEESLKAGKSRLTRKRKRKSSITHVLPKKKQREHVQRSPEAASYSVPPHVVRISDEPKTFSTLNELAVGNENIEVNVNGVNRDKTSELLNESALRMVSPTRREEKEPSELNLKLCELKGETAVSMKPTDRVNVPSGEGQPTGVETSANELRETDGVDPVQPGRCTGAKKRKSGSVKRFKKDPASCSVEDMQITEIPCTAISPMGIQHPDFFGNNINCKNRYDDPYSSCTITQIIKPISYRASILNNVQDVLVAFEAMRSDGTKVTVDNKFLKANNPLLLIDYYERNLRYNPT